MIFSEEQSGIVRTVLLHNRNKIFNIVIDLDKAGVFSLTELINKNTTGLIGAMDEEIEPLLDVMGVSFTRKIAGITFYIGTINCNSIVLARCGVGKVNAAVCAQLMITVFAVDRIIGLGVAGGISRESSWEILLYQRNCCSMIWMQQEQVIHWG